MAEITISKGDGMALFHLPPDAPCPRVGEVLHYQFAANNPETWAKDSWERNKALDGTVWRVTHVEHHVRRNDWNSTRCYTLVTVKRVPEARSSTTGSKR